MDLLTAMQAWLEDDVAPSRILSRSPQGTDNKIVGARPLFPYPAHAAYTGTGDPGNPENFVEVRPQ
jgi:hypothetical protein